MRSSIPRLWREIGARYRLRATKCSDCNRVNYPPSRVCRYCGSKNVAEVYLDRERAKLLTWTVIYVTPSGFEERRPLIIGIVETLETKAKILTQITDVLPEELRRELVVEPVLRRVNEDGEFGLIHYAIAYRPAIK